METPQSTCFQESERAFLQQTARQRVTTYDGHTWEYYDSGKRKHQDHHDNARLPPLLCLPGVSGSAKSFHLQLSELAGKGYRVIAVQHPIVWTHDEWIHSFDRFLDAMGLEQIHVYGVSLGAFLAQRYAAAYPHRIASLVMTQGFCDTSPFAAKSPWPKMISYMPDFVLKKHMLSQLRHHKFRDPKRALAVDYVADHIDKLTQQDAASLLTLQCLPCSPTSWRLTLPDEKITLLDSYEETSLPPKLRHELWQRYPHAKKAMLKDAGEFPFLLHHDQVNLHLQVHLRANGSFPE